MQVPDQVAARLRHEARPSAMKTEHEEEGGRCGEGLPDSTCPDGYVPDRSGAAGAGNHAGRADGRSRQLNQP
jgi:hypothetical protein